MSKNVKIFFFSASFFKIGITFSKLIFLKENLFSLRILINADFPDSFPNLIIPPLIPNTNSLERMRITEQGYVTINFAGTPTYKDNEASLSHSKFLVQDGDATLRTNSTTKTTGTVCTRRRTRHHLVGSDDERSTN